MKKKIIIALIAVLAVILAVIIFFVSFYFSNLKPVDKKDNTLITFIIENGSTLKKVTQDLKDANLIKSENIVYIYAKLNNISNIQAGTYTVKRSMDIKEILEKFQTGDIDKEGFNVSFIEGKRITDYVKVISTNFGYSEDEVYDIITDNVFINELINKYWFLTDDILNKDLYYALEGYLFPDTYTFYKTASIKDIIYTLLDNTDRKLSKYKDDITNSKYSVHELLSMASIIELEGNTNEDRYSISQVIYKRLNIGMSLGMDVTTYYAVKKSMKEGLTYQDLAVKSPYNTRLTDGSMNGKLPVGPICNPSLSSIDAVFNPTDTNYLYFFADIKTGKVYFAENEQGFYDLIKKYS